MMRPTGRTSSRRLAGPRDRRDDPRRTRVSTRLRVLHEATPDGTELVRRRTCPPTLEPGLRVDVVGRAPIRSCSWCHRGPQSTCCSILTAALDRARTCPRDGRTSIPRAVVDGGDTAHPLRAFRATSPATVGWMDSHALMVSSSRRLDRRLSVAADTDPRGRPTTAYFRDRRRPAARRRRLRSPGPRTGVLGSTGGTAGFAGATARAVAGRPPLVSRPRRLRVGRRRRRSTAALHRRVDRRRRDARRGRRSGPARLVARHGWSGPQRPDRASVSALDRRPGLDGARRPSRRRRRAAGSVDASVELVGGRGCVGYCRARRRRAPRGMRAFVVSSVSELSARSRRR